MEINKLLRDCLAMPDDEGAITVEFDSLMPIKGSVNEKKLREHFDEIVAHVALLPKPFLNPEGGWTFLNLPFFDDGHGGTGKQWGEQSDAALLIIACSYFNIVQDPLKTLKFTAESLKDLPGGVGFVSFNIEVDYLMMIKKQLGLM